MIQKNIICSFLFKELARSASEMGFKVILICYQWAKVNAYTASKYGSFCSFSYSSGTILRQNLVVLQLFQ